MYEYIYDGLCMYIMNMDRDMTGKGCGEDEKTKANRGEVIRSRE